MPAGERLWGRDGAGWRSCYVAFLRGVRSAGCRREEEDEDIDLGFLSVSFYIERGGEGRVGGRTKASVETAVVSSITSNTGNGVSLAVSYTVPSTLNGISRTADISIVL